MLETTIDHTAPEHRGVPATSIRGRHASPPKRFGVVVSTDCMSPRFNPGDMLTIEKRANLRIGTDVLIEIAGRNPASAVLGRLMSCSENEFVLLHLNPSSTVTLPSSRVRNIYAIIRCEFADLQAKATAAA